LVTSLQQVKNHDQLDGAVQTGFRQCPQIGIEPMSPVVVNVELYGIVGDLVKDRNLVVSLPNHDDTSLRDVLEELVERHGPAFRDRLFGSQGLLSHVKVYAGGRPVEDLSQRIPTGDESAVRIIVMAAAGGG
jgi:hypothetical protein